MVGGAAVCECDFGFANDGLDQCARCSDPLMKYPSECHKRRKWVLQSDDSECDQLPIDMPHTLYEDENSKG